MQRGDIVLVALPGDYGKPRPAVVVQGDLTIDLPSIVLCPLTTTVREDLPTFRLTIRPSAFNGLNLVSQVMVDKPVTVPRSKITAVIGAVEPDQLSAIADSLAILLGYA